MQTIDVFILLTPCEYGDPYPHNLSIGIQLFESYDSAERWLSNLFGNPNEEMPKHWGILHFEHTPGFKWVCVRKWTAQQVKNNFYNRATG